MEYRIALSASFWVELPVQELLKTCDYIYTTQAARYIELCHVFGEEKIKIIPNQSGELQNLIRSWHPDAAVFTFTDLFELHEAYMHCMRAKPKEGWT